MLLPVLFLSWRRVEILKEDYSLEYRCFYPNITSYNLSYYKSRRKTFYLLRNVGSPQEPVFTAPRQFKCYGTPIACTIHGPSAWAGDLNGDSKPDLLACVEWSVYPFFAHAALETDRHPQYRIELVASAGERCR